MSAGLWPELHKLKPRRISARTLSDGKSGSSAHNLYKNELGCLQRVCFVVKKYVPTFNFTQLLLEVAILCTSCYEDEVSLR